MFELHKIIAKLVLYCFSHTDQLDSYDLDLLIELEELVRKYEKIRNAAGDNL